MNRSNRTYCADAPAVFDLARTLDCGQAFRWEACADGSFTGVIGEKCIHVRQENGRLLFFGNTEADFEKIFRPYLDFDRDYKKILDAYLSDAHLRRAVTACPGIRILRQEPWEALCSFILSQNNNIPRIKGIIQRLCEQFGRPIENGFYTFPQAARLAEKELADLAPLRAGFRAKYVLDAAQKVAAGEVNFKRIADSPTDFGRAELQKICGVGAKVAECTLLYGFGKLDAFPMDVWMKRVMEELYPEGLPACTAGTQGIAQQYLFHWRRTCVPSGR